MPSHLLAAGPGWIAGGVTAVGATVYLVLGPVPEGRVLDYLEVFYSVRAATIVSFGAGFSGSAEASQENYERSSNLIQRGGVTLHGKPAVALDHAGAESFRFDVPLGIEVQAGAKYVVCAVSSTAGGVVTLWNVALFPRFVFKVRSAEG